jgi:cytochrome c oxidase cbb3-type subunit III
MLTATPIAAGDAVAGRTYFAANCASCHSVSGDLKGIATTYDGVTLRQRLLGPPPPIQTDLSGAAAEGRRRHLTLLERYSDEDVRHLVAYLQTATR